GSDQKPKGQRMARKPGESTMRLYYYGGVLFTCSALVSGNAHARNGLAVAISGNPKAGHFLLYRERGLCTHTARRATFNDSRNNPIEGCWKVVSNGNIQITFLDGDYAI